jgi:hypothetical protein
MRRMRWLGLLLCWFAGTAARAQDVPLEYQVKAVYLFNFVKSTEWPPEAATGPIHICVAGKNPFGTALSEAVQNELVNGRPLEARQISEPDPGCHVVFIPESADARPFLQAVRDMPTLTVGESADFLERGGIIRFIEDRGRVRFQIDAEAAKRSALRISAHLLNLSRTAQG